MTKFVFVANHVADFTIRFGQPPQEIINDIAPGLELDEDGMPKINPLQQLPLGENEDCVIM